MPITFQLIELLEIGNIEWKVVLHYFYAIFQLALKWRVFGIQNNPIYTLKLGPLSKESDNVSEQWLGIGGTMIVP